MRKLISFDLHEEKQLIKKISWKKLNIAIPILNHFMFYVCYFCSRRHSFVSEEKTFDIVGLIYVTRTIKSSGDVFQELHNVFFLMFLMVLILIIPNFPKSKNDFYLLKDLKWVNSISFVLAPSHYCTRVL